MNIEYEWGPWIEHDGRGCPIVGQLAQVVFQNPIRKAPPHYTILSPYMVQGVVKNRSKGRAGNSWNWKLGNRAIRYRVRRPRVTEWLSEITTNLPERVDA